MELKKTGIRGLRHDHIDGSKAVLDCLEQLTLIAGLAPGELTPEILKARFKNVHKDIVGAFKNVNDLLQTAEALKLLGLSYVLRRADEGYTYVHAKFAPQYHVFGGLTMKEATEAMLSGIRVGEEITNNTKVFPQLCIGREASVDTGKEIAKIVLDYDGDVGLDMACDEAAHAPEKHFEAYKMTFGTKVHRDCHAGERVKKGQTKTYWSRLSENIETAIDLLQCHQIGHAISLGFPGNEDLVQKVIDKGITIAGCPLSNLATGAVPYISMLQIDDLLAKGVRYTLNSDDDLFLPDMDAVVTSVARRFPMSKKMWNQLAQNAAEP